MGVQNVLMVDDRPENLITLEAVLDPLQVNTIRANSGAEALDLALKQDIDLVLLDVQMPEMDGFEVASYLKRVKRTADVPIIFVTAISKEKKHMQHGYDVGAVDYLAKPIDPELLLSKVAVFLKMQEQKREIAEKNSELVHFASTLEEERKNLQQAQAIAKMGSWSWEFDTEIFHHTEQLGELFGLHGDLTLEDVFNAIHPEEQEHISAHVMQVIKIPESIELEYRIVRTDGTIRRVKQVCKVVELHGSQHLLSTIQDISELRDIEDKLNITQEVFKHAVEGVMVTDAEGIIESVNPAFTEITGYATHEVIGQSPRILKSDRHDEAFYKEMWEKVTKEGCWQGEVWNRRKNGEAYPEMLSINAILDYEGIAKNYIAVFSDLSDSKQNEEQLTYQKNHDPLTGLYNRVMFKERVNSCVDDELGEQKKCAVFHLNLKGFKKINESLGLALGDELLREVAKRLSTVSTSKHHLARLGADEFAWMEVSNEGVNHFIEMRQDILNCFKAPFEFAGQSVRVEANLGISVAPDNGCLGEEILKAAAIALSRAKKDESSNCLFFNDDMEKEAEQRMQMESELWVALEKEEFELHYQPKVCLKSGEVIGMEALVRWNKPDSGLVRPDLFIPLAEETGIIVPMGKWILKEACRQTKRWVDEGYTLKVAVNLSVKQFQDKALLDTIDEAIAETGLDAKHLELEITESMMMHNVDQAIEVMHQIRERGIELSIDDFGTGHSSFAYIKRFPIHSLKIDQAFIRPMTPGSNEMALVEAMVSIGNKLNLVVIAEGVEEAEHVDFLKSVGCDLIQGYYYSKPLPTDGFDKLLLENKNLFAMTA